MYFNPICTDTPHYLHLYISNGGSCTAGEEGILIAFTQQEIRSMEQSVSTFAEPIFYTGKQVNTQHNNWRPGDIYASMVGKQTV